MSQPPPTNRRSLVAGATLGIVVGGAWGAAIQALATPSRPRLSILGRGRSQITLLDTGSARVVIFLGGVEKDVLARVPAMMTMFRQRIDIMIGPASSLQRYGLDLRRRWNVDRIILVRDQAGFHPEGVGEMLVNENTAIDLERDISIDLELTSRNAWSTAEGSHFRWVAQVRVYGYQITLGPDVASIRDLGGPQPMLVVVPDGSLESIVRSVRPDCIAMNRRDDLDLAESDSWLVRIYPEDVAVFELGETSMTLPTWAEQG